GPDGEDGGPRLRLPRGAGGAHEAVLRGGAPRARALRPPGAGPRRAAALGPHLRRRADEGRAVRLRRRGAAALLPPRVGARGLVPPGGAPLRGEGRARRGRTGLAPRRAGLRPAPRGRHVPRVVLRRLVPARVEARRGVDEPADYWRARRGRRVRAPRGRD